MILDEVKYYGNSKIIDVVRSLSKVQKVHVIIEMNYPNCDVDDTHKDPAVRHLESGKTVAR